MELSCKNQLAATATKIRMAALEGVFSAQSGHPGGSLSIADILAYLYFKEMKVDASRPHWEERDRLVLSKGHTAPALYAALALKGFFPLEEMKHLRQVGALLQGHPDMKTIPGVDMSSGSLGQGVSAAAGMALAGKLDGADWRVYTILGDGEIEEGQVWEAAMFAAHKKLDNLCVIVDNNDLQIDGSIGEVNSPYPIPEKFEAFGFHVVEIDGHDFDQIEKALDEAKTVKGKPTAVIMKTVKGKGVSFMENQVGWHGSAPKQEQYDIAMAELKQTLAEYEGYNDGGYRKVATRDSYGAALVELGAQDPNVVVLDADLAAATKTGAFKKAYPDRFFDAGIAEGNMMGVAAGLAAAGKTVFASSFAMFAAGRAFEQVRNSIGYPHLNVKIGATHAGISVGEDGATHQCCEDIALMRTIPGMTILNPADDNEAKQAVKAAAAMNGPVYLRFGRLAVPVVMPADYVFEIGKSVQMTDGDDVTIIATGLMVQEALIAAEQLKSDGIAARVINMATIKPIDRDAIVRAAQETGLIVTAEEHNIIGGLGSAVTEVVCETVPVPVVRLGVNDTFGKSGKAVELLKKFGLCADNLTQVVKQAMSKKNA